MNINAIIHEQIEWDGSAKSFQLKADQSIGDLWIAFPTDYASERNAPFYFLDKEYETSFHKKQANCRQIKLSAENFYQGCDSHIFKTTWQRIPTERQSLTYYALYLPEYAIPTDVKVTDTRNTAREFTKNVFRDDEKNRFVVYIKCTSKFGQFNFDILCKFYFDKTDFSTSQYKDEKTVDFYAHLDHWKYMLPQEDIEQIEKVFVTNHYYSTMGDQYNINQAGAVGPNSTASNNTFNQLNNSLPENTDYEKLTTELFELRQSLLPKAKLPEHYIAIGELTKAEEASRSKDGNTVIKSLVAAGKWVLDAAKDIGTDVLTEVIKNQIGV
jgi:hypothetical protein